MDKLSIELDKKIKNLFNRFSQINCSNNCEFKKKLILYDDINSKLDDLDNIIDEFEITNQNELELDEELNYRIEENKKQNDFIKKIAPYIILYQLNNI